MFSEYKGLRKELYVLFVGRIMTNLGSMVWPMMTLILNQKLGLSAGEIADYLLILSIVQIPISLWGGKLTDRLNKRNIIIVCDLVSVACYMYCGLVPLDRKAIIIFALASLFQTVEWPAFDALVADFSSPKDRERAFSLNYLGVSLGLILAPTLGGILINNYLWLAFIINGTCIFISTVLIFLMIKDVSRSEDENDVNEYESDLEEGVSTFRFVFRNRVLVLYIIGAVLCNALYNQYNYLMPIELAAWHGESGSVIYGTMSSTNCITVVLFTAYFTKIFKRLRDLDKLLLGSALELLGIIIFRSFSFIFVSAYVAIIVFTFGEIINTLGSSPFSTRRIPANHRGRFSSIMNVSSSILVSLFTKIIGTVYDSQGSWTTWLIVFGVGMVEVLLLLLIKKYDRLDYPNLYR